MSKVLYREYRPLTLDDVQGQDHIVNALKNALKNDAIAHAYLFTGSHGVGKTSVARILAHLINDLEYTGENNHLDIIEIDAASNRRIDEIRDLREKAFIAPTSAKYKVYIIDEVHMLTREAFNALLKTLEEPPEHTIFILATTEAHKVPRTIISRTQRFSFKPQDNESLVSRLSFIAKKESISIEDSALQLIARHSNKSYRDAISLLDQIRYIREDTGNKTITAANVAQVIGAPSKELLAALVDSLLSGDTNQLFTTTEELRNQGISATIVSQELLQALRQLLVEHNSGSRSVVNVMKVLLENINNATFDTIEVALLTNMNFDHTSSHNSPVVKSNHATPINTPRSTEKINVQDSKGKLPAKSSSQANKISENLIKEKTPKPKESDPAVPVNNNVVTWSEVLVAIKGHHNTLYGILKMSSAQISYDTVNIAFRFGFHEKQFLQTKHTTILKNILKEKSGREYVIKTTVDSSQSKINTQQVRKKSDVTVHNKDLKSISNIFSGAELLE